jgi:hypothetical protein
MEVSDAKRLKALENENRRAEQMVAGPLRHLGCVVAPPRPPQGIMMTKDEVKREYKERRWRRGASDLA